MLWPCWITFGVAHNGITWSWVAITFPPQNSSMWWYTFSLDFIIRFIYPLGAGHALGSRGSSTPSESSAVPISVKKTHPKWQRSDEDVWEWTDAKIIGMSTELVNNLPRSSHCAAESQKTWRSTTYSHYSVSLQQCHQTKTLTFQFTCRFDPLRHPSITCRRLDTSQGTSNLERSRKKCQQLCGKDASSSTPPPRPIYSRLKHRVLIAAHCASSRCPFNSVPIHIISKRCRCCALKPPCHLRRQLLGMFSQCTRLVRKLYTSTSRFVISLPASVLMLTNLAETQRCCSSGDGWVDVTDLGMLPWYRGYLVLSWSDTPVHFRVCQVRVYFLHPSLI